MVDGIYRVDGPSSCTVVADIGAFALAHTPNANIFLVTGVQYAMEPYRGGFLVTDGHHNRVYRVTLDGAVSEFITFGNVVPTGLQVLGNTIYMAEAGHAPHHPEDGKVVAFSQGSSTATVVASGARLLVDVERGRGNTLFALSQGDFPACDELSGQCAAMAGTPALHNTGSLLKVNNDGTLTEVAGTEGLDQPTSLRSSARPHTWSRSAARSGGSTTSSNPPTMTAPRAAKTTTITAPRAAKTTTITALRDPEMTTTMAATAARADTTDQRPLLLTP